MSSLPSWSQAAKNSSDFPRWTTAKGPDIHQALVFCKQTMTFLTRSCTDVLHLTSRRHLVPCPLAAQMVQGSSMSHLPRHGWSVEATECHQSLDNKVRQRTFEEVKVISRPCNKQFQIHLRTKKTPPVLQFRKKMRCVRSQGGSRCCHAIMTHALERQLAALPPQVKYVHWIDSRKWRWLPPLLGIVTHCALWLSMVYMVESATS